MNTKIFSLITKNLQDSITNKKIELEAEMKKHYPINLQKEHEQKIKFIEGQIERLTNKYEEIKKITGPRYLLRFDKDDGGLHPRLLDETPEDYQKDCAATAPIGCIGHIPAPDGRSIFTP